MKNLLNDFISFIQSVNLMDLFFFGSVIVLLILIVVLIYLIRLNEDKDEDIINDTDDVKDDTSDDELNLADIATAIEEEEPKPIILNNYEQEQEAKAIISYDELVATTNKPEEQINYKKEEDIEGLKIKSVDLDNITQPIPIDLPKEKEEIKQIVPENKTSILISYEKEEEFLDTLKKLQKILN